MISWPDSGFHNKVCNFTEMQTNFAILTIKVREMMKNGINDSFGVHILHACNFIITLDGLRAGEREVESTADYIMASCTVHLHTNTETQKNASTKFQTHNENDNLWHQNVYQTYCAAYLVCMHAIWIAGPHDLYETK